MDYLEVRELYHHGIKGQKHGVRRAEWYPIAEWKASQARRRDLKADKLESKAKKLRSKNQNESRNYEIPKRKEYYDNESDRKAAAKELIESRDVDRIYRDSKVLTNQELGEALAAIEKENRLSKYYSEKHPSKSKKVKDGFAYVDKTVNTIDKIDKWITVGGKVIKYGKVANNTANKIADNIYEKRKRR